MALVGLAVSILVQAVAFLLFAMGITGLVHLVQACSLLRRMARAGRPDYSLAILKSPLAPAVSTVATPPDASPESLRFARRLLDLHFGRNEVVIVLDGPSSEEMQIWKRELRLCPSTRGLDRTLPTAPLRGVYESTDPVRMVLIDKERRGSVDAWNAGVNAATSPVIALLDPASEFIPEVLLRLIQPMLEAMDETTAVIGGVPSPPGNGMTAQFGALESLRAWLTRAAHGASRNLPMPFSGCAALVKRNAIVQAKGFTGGILELFVRLHGVSRAAGKSDRVVLLPEPLSYRRSPGTLADLRHQTEQEQREIAQAFRNRVTLAGPFGWGILRNIYYARLIRPWLEVLGFGLTLVGLLLGWVDIFTAMLMVLSTVGMGMVLSMAAVVLRELAEPNSSYERRMAAMFWAAIPENLIYRQRRNLWLIGGFRKASAAEKQNRGSEAQGTPPAVSATVTNK